MMPLTMAAANEINYIKKVGGNSEVKRHLETLGFVAGGEVRVISQLNGNLIVSIKDSRVAIWQKRWQTRSWSKGKKENEDIAKYCRG